LLGWVWEFGIDDFGDVELVVGFDVEVGGDAAVEAGGGACEERGACGECECVEGVEGVCELVVVVEVVLVCLCEAFCDGGVVVCGDAEAEGASVADER